MRDYFQISLRSIMSNKLRSGMTLLGVVIGVWAITSMQAVVKGFDRAIEDELSALGSETFVIQKYPPIVLVHAQRDHDVPYSESVNMDKVLTEKGVDHLVITLPGER